MKLNNKGFAITAVLYGLLILFVILVSSYLLILSSRKNKLDAITKDIENSYFEIDSYSDDDSGGTTPSSSGETGGTTPSSPEYTVRLYIDDNFNGESSVSEENDYKYSRTLILNATPTADSGCTNNQNLEINNVGGLKFTIKIEKVTDNTECYIKYD